MLNPCFIRRSRDYQRALLSRQCVTGDHWQLHYVRNASLSAARFAVVVTKRHLRSSVRRNRVRRVLREYIRQELRQQLPPMDYVIRSHSALDWPLNAAQLREECRQLLALVKYKQR